MDNKIEKEDIEAAIRYAFNQMRIEDLGDDFLKSDPAASVEFTEHMKIYLIDQCGLPGDTVGKIRIDFDTAEPCNCDCNHDPEDLN